MTERWIAKRDRQAFRNRKGKSKKDLASGFQGVSLPGGGIGGTGSARIGKQISSVSDVEMQDVAKEITPATANPAVAVPSLNTSNNKKKKKKGKK